MREPGGRRARDGAALALIAACLGSAGLGAGGAGSRADRIAARTVLVPSGEVLIGHDGRAAEGPARRVLLPEFWMDTTEVTAGAFRACVQAGRCAPGDFRISRDDEACNYGAPGRGDHPMNCVDWHGAGDYCEFVGGRLPTGPMWEKTARGGCEIHERLGYRCGAAPFDYPWGPEAPTCERAVFKGGGAECRSGGTTPVGGRAEGASPYGALDMSGNVWEWVADVHETPRPGEAEASRVVRGGGHFCDSATHLTTTHRAAAAPSRRSSDIGFRCAYDARDRPAGRP